MLQVYCWIAHLGMFRPLKATCSGKTRKTSSPTSPCVVCLSSRTLLLPKSLGVLETAPVQNSLGISHSISKWTQTMSLSTYLMSIIGEDEASNTWLKVRQRYASGLIFRLSQEHLRKGSPQIDSEYWNGHVRMLCAHAARSKTGRIGSDL